MPCVEDLKTSAKNAKQRFRHGYWKQFLVESKDKIEKMKAGGLSEVEAKRACAERAKHEIKMKYSGETEDSLFYEKVCLLLSSSEILINPIKKLIETDIYENLNDKDKQNYILNLSTKFARMKERYEREKQIS